MHIAAAVDVDAIAVGVDLEAVDGKIVDAGSKNAAMAALRA